MVLIAPTRGSNKQIRVLARAFTALVLACIVAGDVANRIAGNADLSVSATGRGSDMAWRYGDPGLIGFAR